LTIGLDIGSTTLKAVVLDAQGAILYRDYRRHYAKIAGSAAQMLRDIEAKLGPGLEAGLCISGSAGMGIAQQSGISFVQEVYATRTAVNARVPGADVVIELGGEDAKILFLTASPGGAEDLEVRMNGSCAGGTGAFIDQMATLLAITPDALNDMALTCEKTYTVASRCGVFAKSDIQPLLNQGARKADIAASILQAVVNQTIAGLAQGRPMAGKVVYLGGPLTFLPALRQQFDETLGLRGLCPEESLYFVALGAAMGKRAQVMNIAACAEHMENYASSDGYISCPPLFESEADYADFTARHARSAVETRENPDYCGPVYMGMDAGSTTFKAVVLTGDGDILFRRYHFSDGNPVAMARQFLLDFYAQHPGATVMGSAVTGYGEDILKAAFGVDHGLVETVAHFTAARAFQPEVDFIIDIGGQDIKCFKIRNGAIDNIFLNEACSSGCGSFLQTFAAAWGMTPPELAERGLLARRPVDLGSRCTVFMNSSVKQAQKDGAGIEDISAGLSISVVKNALYKVIRAANADGLGQHIVVQGGTFLSDAVLRAFEQEVGREVVRPGIAGLMGAYGAALYAKAQAGETSSLLGPAALTAFEHHITVTACNGCENHCRLTVNTFDGGRRFIGGNRCERAFGGKVSGDMRNLYAFKRELLRAYTSADAPATLRGKLGLPMGLNFYELLPFWHTVLSGLNFEVVASPPSSRELYLLGQKTIPSDTVCYPAKLLHGHVEALLEAGVDAIFYPCLTYNIDEGLGDNHYNCPVVAYYPEVLAANTPGLQDKLIYDYMTLQNERFFARQLQKALARFGKIPTREIKAAFRRGYEAHHAYLAQVRAEAERYLREAEAANLPVIVLAGRPYHLDEEVGHGIDRLVCDLGAVLISEDGISHLAGVTPTHVLDQWTYHARLYAAARQVTQLPSRVSFVQLVSFGCGLDAVTTDEARRILEGAGRIYTQIKIDEITNLGAVKIRLRSLFAALAMQKNPAREEASAR